ncbi:MAG: type IX secretion system sortase PorU [Bacteroidetes bacterium]|nr:type IX secretion system sortase PorU [Bacteroidota bacterium]
MFSAIRVIRFSGIAILMFVACAIRAQDFHEVKIPWIDAQSISLDGQNIKIPSIKDQSYNDLEPSFFWKNKVAKNKIINSIQFISSIATSDEMAYLNEYVPILPSQPKIISQISKAGNESFAVLDVKPFYRENNQIKKVISVSFTLSGSNSTEFFTQKDFVANSVLKDGSGIWYKIAVDRDGIYKIDKSFLESCGINTTNLNPSHINIYGNGEGLLPEKNSLPRTDDLAKNAIFIQGGGDGSFDNSDYILFYGWGPHRWDVKNGSEFQRTMNVYSDDSYYFINVDPNNTPLRIQNLPELTGTSTITVSSYDFRDVYENDLVNLVGGGKRWYGELFDVELEKTFNFSIPNIDTVPIRIMSSLATNGTGVTQTFSLNGSTLFNSNVSFFSDFTRTESNFSFTSSSSNIPLKLTITRTNPSVLTYLDRITLNTRRKLVFYGTQMNFRNLTQSQSGSICEYIVSSLSPSGFIWDLSEKNNPKRILGNFSNGNFSFKSNYNYTEYVASNGTSFFTPKKVGSVAYQNLHGLEQVDFLIVTHPDFIAQANRLADLHRDQGTSTHVVTTEQVYNEFSSGAPDAVAMRMFAKMFHDRAILNPGTELKYLLLFGDGTYDPKNRVANNNNKILTYQADNSENYISCYVSDDFFGMLDDNESFTSADMLDIGIGRILASDVSQAKQQVDKIEHYMKNGSQLFNSNNASCCFETNSNKTYGDWKLKYVQIADDEENNYFIVNDTEPQYEEVLNNHFEMNCDKLYLDAYPQQTTAGGQRYPDVYNAISDRIQRGALLVNYVGHGGEVGLAEERVVTIPQINSWTNINALNLFVSATCEFTKYDDPKRVSAGELVSLNPNGGAIALMTTTRSVYFGVNTSVGNALFDNVFNRHPDNSPLTFGEIMMRTKNDALQSDNKRSFTLIGDPALKIALPELLIKTDSINGKNPIIVIDTLNALSKVRIKGHIEDYQGNVQNNFNGVLIPSIFDKVKTMKTLGQDPESPEMEYDLQRNIVYKGKSSITNGYFDFSFVVPKDIALNIGKGKISYYAFNDLSDAYGYDTNFRIGGINPNGITDNEGPQLELFLNDESFVSGGITDETPVLILKAFDENGINTVGNGIGHDITAIIDDKTAEPIILNEYYASELDSYQAGEIRYQLSALEPGEHNLSVKVWDVNNNSSSVRIEFNVQEKKAPQLDKVYNFPNPFSTRTEFMFEHNQSCSFLDAQIQVYTISGKLVKTISKTIDTKGFRVDGIDWDGMDEFGDPLAKGVYIYRLKIKNDLGETAEKTEKLVILR